MWGSGVQSKDGLHEGEYTLREAMLNFHNLKRFEYFSLFSEAEFNKLKLEIKKISVTENTSRNTLSELEACFEYFQREEIDLVILVSSATHASRCLRDACKVLSRRKDQGMTWNPTLLTCPSETCYDSYAAEDVIIIEPPHLPSDVLDSQRQLSMHSFGKRCLLADRNDQKHFRIMLHELLEKFNV
jgi:hypothetical protein